MSVMQSVTYNGKEFTVSKRHHVANMPYVVTCNGNWIGECDDFGDANRLYNKVAGRESRIAMGLPV